MKERPILFSAPMVRAILGGTKTQTRRIIKPQPDLIYCGEPNLRAEGAILKAITCPYGQPGDRLWVREAHQLHDVSPHGYPQCLIAYPADDTVLICDPGDGDSPRKLADDERKLMLGDVKTRPSIHMPRWASRITLEIVSIRAERLNEISEHGALAEGIEYCDLSDTYHANGKLFTTARSAFAELWESINGAGSWGSNPIVWVVEFKRVEGGAA